MKFRWGCYKIQHYNWVWAAPWNYPRSYNFFYWLNCISWEVVSWMYFVMCFVRLPELLYREIMILWMRLYFTLHWKRRRWSGDCTGRKNWPNFAYKIQIHIHAHTVSSVRLLKTLFWIHNVSLSPGPRRMQKWQTSSATTSARTGGGKQHWKMPFLFWESSGSSILLPSSF